MNLTQKKKIQNTKYPIPKYRIFFREIPNNQQITNPNHYLNWCSKKPDIVAKTSGSTVNYPIRLFKNTWVGVWSIWIKRRSIWDAKVVSWSNLIWKVLELEPVDSTPKCHLFASFSKNFAFLLCGFSEREMNENPSRGSSFSSFWHQFLQLKLLLANTSDV